MGIKKCLRSNWGSFNCCTPTHLNNRFIGLDAQFMITHEFC